MAEEADLQMQASEIRHGFRSTSMKTAGGLAVTGKTANRLIRVSRKEIRSTLTTETKTAREKENCAEHAMSRIILRTVKVLLDGPEVGNGKPRNNLDFVIDA